MVGPVPYVFLPGSARAALTFYRDVFGGSLTLHTYAELGRDDGPADAIAHGVLSGAVDLYAADVSGEQHPLRVEGLSFALLGAAPPATLRGWFDHLAAGGTVIDPLAVRARGATDGQLLDRYGIHWLIGYEGTS